MVYSYKYKRGTILLVSLVDGCKYEAQFISGNSEFIKVRNVATYPNGTKDNFTFEFHKDEVVDIVVLEEIEDSGSDVEEDLMELLDNQQYMNLKEKARKNIFISKLSMRYADALEHIRGEETLAITRDGTQYGPTDRIQFLMVATRYYVFIFDIESLGAAAFEKGLKEVLENKSILKIVYNHSVLNDSLKRHHDVLLNHIFDVQLADFILEQPKNAEEMDYMCELPILVEKYLYMTDLKQQRMEINMIHIMQRPVSRLMLRALAMKVSLLFDLWNALNDKLHANHCKATALFVSLHNIKPVPDDMFIRIPELFRAIRLLPK